MIGSQSLYCRGLFAQRTVQSAAKCIGGQGRGDSGAKLEYLYGFTTGGPLGWLVPVSAGDVFVEQYRQCFGVSIYTVPHRLRKLRP